MNFYEPSLVERLVTDPSDYTITGDEYQFVRADRCFGGPFFALCHASYHIQAS
jgi:hypothetical protein